MIIKYAIVEKFEEIKEGEEKPVWAQISTNNEQIKTEDVSEEPEGLKSDKEVNK